VKILCGEPMRRSDLWETGKDGQLVGPSAVLEAKARVAEADAIAIVSPEYNYSVSCPGPWLLSRLSRCRRRR
jgi:hypothetical protein